MSTEASEKLVAHLAEDAAERFLRYVRIDTQSAEESETYPSTDGQLVLLRLLRDELEQAGLPDATIDEHGYVTATLPATVEQEVPTIALFAPGVALLALDRTHGPIVGLHKASFVVWLGALGVHVLTRLPRLWSAWQLRIPGLSLRLAAVAGSLLAGFAVATLTLPAADQLQDGISAHVGLDDR